MVWEYENKAIGFDRGPVLIVQDVSSDEDREDLATRRRSAEDRWSPDSEARITLAARHSCDLRNLDRNTCKP